MSGRILVSTNKMSIDYRKLLVDYKEKIGVWLGSYEHNGKNKLLTTDYRTLLILKSLSAVRTKGKIPIHFPSTVWASLSTYCLLNIHPVAMFIKDSIAIFTDQKGVSFFNRKEGDEKQAQIMINPF